MAINNDSYVAVKLRETEHCLKVYREMQTNEYDQEDDKANLVEKPSTNEEIF